MGMLAFFGAIGGMKNFMIAILGKFGGYFSGKFFGAKLMTDLYIEKKRNKKSSTTMKEGGHQDKLKNIEDYNK